MLAASTDTLTITQSAPVTPAISTPVTWTIRLRNGEPNNAWWSIALDALPPGMSAMSPDCSGSTTVVCEPGALRTGQAATFTVAAIATTTSTTTTTTGTLTLTPPTTRGRALPRRANRVRLSAKSSFATPATRTLTVSGTFHLRRS